MFLDWAKCWLASNKDLLSRRNLTVKDCHETPADAEKPAIVIDIDSADKMGRMTLWSTGECDVETLVIDSGETVLWQNLLCKNEQDVNTVFRRLIEQLK